MMDYFGSNGNNETDAAGAGSAQPATNGDAAMDDEVLVSSYPLEKCWLLIFL